MSIIQAILAFFKSIPALEKILKGLGISKTEAEKAVKKAKDRLKNVQETSHKVNKAIKKAKDEDDTDDIERMLNKW